jgi:hypothetical protein
LFDSKRRLRQGTWNLQLHLDKAADTSLDSQTPGLTEDPTTLEINNILRGIHKWQKRSDAKSTWLDRLSFQALSEKLFSLYMDQRSVNPGAKDHHAYLEVSFPEFGVPVLYCNQQNTVLRKKYIFPSYLVEGY